MTDSEERSPAFPADCPADDALEIRPRFEPDYAPRPFLRLELTAETIATTAGLDALGPDWCRLEACSTRAILFQSFDWCAYIWRTHTACPTRDKPALRIIVVRDARGVVAIWPLSIRASAAGRFAQDLSEPFGQYSDLLVVPDVALDQVMSVALAEVARWRVDGVVLRKVRADADLAPWLAANASRIGATELAPAIALSEFDGFDAYHRSINAKTRKNLRNYRNRLARLGRLGHAVVEAPDARAAVIERCFLRRTDWLETSGLSSTAFADPLFRSVVTGLARGERGAPAVLAMRLGLGSDDDGASGDDIDLSVHWGFVHQRRYYAFMAAKNPAYDAFSPGRLQLEDVIAACAERGVATVDLLLPAMPYKATWATTSVEVHGYGLALSLRGRLVIQGWHRFLRPALKRLIMALPPGVRRFALLRRTQ